MKPITFFSICFCMVVQFVNAEPKQNNWIISAADSLVLKSSPMDPTPVALAIKGNLFSDPQDEKVIPLEESEPATTPESSSACFPE